MGDESDTRPSADGQPGYSEIRVRRLMASVYCTRYERALGRIVTFVYRHSPSERGPLSWLGDRLNDAQVHSWHRRAAKGRHFKGARPKIARAQGGTRGN